LVTVRAETTFPTARRRRTRNVFSKTCCAVPRATTLPDVDVELEPTLTQPPKVSATREFRRYRSTTSRVGVVTAW
jgi:hypothetical protein